MGAFPLGAVISKAVFQSRTRLRPDVLRPILDIPFTPGLRANRGDRSGSSWEVNGALGYLSAWPQEFTMYCGLHSGWVVVSPLPN